MFLKRVCNHILSTVSTVNVNTLRALNISLGKSETELVDKWKQRFADEKITEIDPSIRNILEHVIRKNKVNLTISRFPNITNAIMMFCGVKINTDCGPE